MVSVNQISWLTWRSSESKRQLLSLIEFDDFFKTDVVLRAVVIFQKVAESSQNNTVKHVINFHKLFNKGYVYYYYDKGFWCNKEYSLTFSAA